MSVPVAIKYRAFLSYAHADASWAQWLHGRLEGFRVDSDMVGRETVLGPIPNTLRPIFRDREDFTGGQSLTEATIAALDASAALIVLCSTVSATRQAVNEEVRLFKSRHPDRPVIPVIVDGTHPKNFPSALRFHVGTDGAVTDRPVTILAADLREGGDGKSLGLAKVIAGLTGVGTDEIVRRAQRAQQRRLRNWVAGLSLVVIALAGLTLWAEINRRDAVDQRRIAVLHQQEAELRRGEAVQTRNEALLSQSKVLADLSKSETDQGNPAAGLLLALEALPDATSTDEIARTRPYWAPAQVGLERARRELRELSVLNGHVAFVTSVAVTPDGKRVVTGSWDGTASIFDSRTGEQVAMLQGHTARVLAVAAMGDGRRVVTASQDGTARVWQMDSGAELVVLRGHEKEIPLVAVMPDGERIVTASNDLTIRLWDGRTGAQLAAVKGHEFAITGLAVAHDGSHIVTAGADYSIRIWELPTLKPGANFSTNPKAEINERGSHSVVSLGLSDDGTRVVTGSDDGTARIWDAKSGAELNVLGPRAGTVMAVTFTPDGERVISGSGNLNTAGQRRLAHSDRDNSLRIWDARTGAELNTLKGHDGTISSVAVFADGSRLVTGAEDATARIWNIKKDVVSIVLDSEASAVGSVAVSPDGTRVVAGTDAGTIIAWDAFSGVRLLQFKGHDSGITGVAFSPDARLIATGSTDGTARVWDAASGAQIAVLNGRGDWITSVAFTRDGERLVTGSGWFAGRHFSTDTTKRENVARVWDARSGSLLATLAGHSLGITSVVVTRDGKHFVTSSLDNTIRLWDAATAAEVAVFRGHEHFVSSVAVTPDGSRIVSGSWDLTARIWDVQSGTQLHVLRGHGGLIGAVAVTPDGARAITASVDGTIRLWDIATGTELVVLKGHEGGVTSVAVPATGPRIHTGSEDGKVRVWQLAGFGQPLIEQAKALVPRCLTPEQRETYFLSRTPPAWCRERQKWPYDVKSALIQGRGLLERRKDAEAEELFTQAVTYFAAAAQMADALRVEAFIRRGADRVREGNEAAANEHFARALSLDSTAALKVAAARALATVEFAGKLLGENKREQAEVKFAVALALDPDVAPRIEEVRVDAYVAESEQLSGQGRIEDSRVLLDEARRHTPSPVQIEHIAKIYNELAWRLFLAGRAADGLEDAEKALGLSPKNASFLDTRGQIHLALNQADEACRDLMHAVELGITMPGTSYGLGRCREMLGDPASAVESYRQAIKQVAVEEFGTAAQKKARERLEIIGAHGLEVEGGRDKQR